MAARFRTCTCERDSKVHKCSPHLFICAGRPRDHDRGIRDEILDEHHESKLHDTAVRHGQE